MSHDDVRAAIIDVLVNVLPIQPDIDGSANLEDHGLTSFESVGLVVALEERFGLTFPDDVLLVNNFQTIDLIVDLVQTVQSAAAAGQSACTAAGTDHDPGPLRFALPTGLTEAQARAVVDRLVYSIEGVRGATLVEDTTALLVNSATPAAADELPGLIDALAEDVTRSRMMDSRRLRQTTELQVSDTIPAAIANVGDVVSARAQLHRIFDLMFLNVALAAGARERRYPALINIDLMRRCRYVDLFPQNAYLVDELPHQREVLVRMRQGAVSAEDVRRSSSYMLNPALCFHTYGEFARTQLTEGLLLTAVGECFRHEAPWRLNDFRRTSFTMREIPFIGRASEVEDHRNSFMDIVWDIFVELGLCGWLETATDPFYYVEDAAVQQHQLLASVKYELVAQRPSGETSAIASFNNIRNSLCRQFDISTADGVPAHSGCAAFGIDRWAEIILETYGADPGGWPKPLHRLRDLLTSR